MRKLICIPLLMLAPVAVAAQDIATGGTSLPAATVQSVPAAPQLRFGYLSYDAALKAMPAYATARQNLASLKAQYDAETKRSEEEFNEKYEEFLSVQQELDAPILRKRQAELQELLDKGVSFKAEAARLLAQAEADMYAPLRSELDALLAKLGRERGYAFILNADGNALPFVNMAYGEDITETVINLFHN